MPSYLFLTDSNRIISNLQKFLPNHFVEKDIVLEYKYKNNYIYINKLRSVFGTGEVDNTSVFNFFGILDYDYKFTKIFVLAANFNEQFRCYVNKISIVSVKSESDVIVFNLKNNFIVSDFYFDSLSYCCYRVFPCCCDTGTYKLTSSDYISVNLENIPDTDFNPDYFINYFNENTKKNKSVKGKIMTIDG